MAALKPGARRRPAGRSFAAVAATDATRAASVAAVLALLSVPAAAQFNMVPPPQCPPQVASPSTTPEAYRLEAARHVYECFPGRVYLGPLPPLIYGIVTVEAEIDAKGRITTLNVVRKPAAEEVEPWVVAVLRRAMPFPAPVNLPGGVVRLVETFFVDRSGLFQTHTLNEGQQGAQAAPTEAGAPLVPLRP